MKRVMFYRAVSNALADGRLVIRDIGNGQYWIESGDHWRDERAFSYLFSKDEWSVYYPHDLSHKSMKFDYLQALKLALWGRI